MLAKAQSGRENTLAGRWIGQSCNRQSGDAPSDVLLLGREELRFPKREEPASRIHIQLWSARGRVTVDRFGSFDDPVGRRTTLDLDAADAESLLALVKDGGYAQMAPAKHMYTICDPGRETMLQSCIDGRYYAVYRHCEHSDDVPNLDTLAKRIDAFLTARNIPQG